MKMRSKLINYSFAIILIIIGINLCFASITIGNLSGDIDSSYGPGEILRGWINVSITDEFLNSSITFSYSDQNITLIDLIKNNSVSNWNCSPSDCKDYYSAVDGSEVKTFNLTRGSDKVIGLWLSGILSNSITNMYFNLSSDSAQACSQQLKIDIAEDNDLDWIPTVASGDYNCSKSSGNYDSTEQTRPWTLSPDTQYCEKIRVPAIASMQIGAYITKMSGTLNTIYMSAYDKDINSIGTCEISNANAGEYYCTINNAGFLNDTDIYVCIKGPDNYEIRGENAGNVSGFYGIDNNNQFTYDYSIFAKGGKYERIGSFVFDSNSFRNFDRERGVALNDYLKDYLSSKYNNNCQGGCIIPIKFIAGENQQVTVSNLLLRYDTTSGNTGEKKFFNLNKKNPKLNSGFMVLDLAAANFIIPNSTQNITGTVRINGDTIVRKQIEIKSIPIIGDVTPKTAPALIQTNFILTMESAEANMTYKWNFGDNSSEETTNKTSIMHTYQIIGNYILKINVRGRNSEANKTFNIEVVSPKSLINSTIAGYETDIANFESQLGSYGGNVKAEIERNINLSSIKDSIAAEKRAYGDGTIDDTKAIQIMRELISLKIPTRVYISKSVKPSAFFMNRDQLDLDRLSDLGAGNKAGSFDENFLKINSWIKDNLNVTVESKTYSSSFRGKPDETLFSNIIINLKPISSISELFIIINGNTDFTKFKEDYGAKDKIDFMTITLNDLSSSKTIDFIYPAITDSLNLPVAISPKFSDLSDSIPLPCNLNKICEKDLEENSENCPDCKKSWLGITLIGLGILIIVFFIVYIILQEWYKRKYESHLFRDKNQLYNLINFINNSETQEIPKSDVFKKLREMGWNGEQLTYAWNKLHSKRTGMWEIPIFRGSENKKVHQELLKRQSGAGSPPARGFNSRTGPAGMGRR